MQVTVIHKEPSIAAEISARLLPAGVLVTEAASVTEIAATLPQLIVLVLDPDTELASAELKLATSQLKRLHLPWVYWQEHAEPHTIAAALALGGSDFLQSCQADCELHARINAHLHNHYSPKLQSASELQHRLHCSEQALAEQQHKLQVAERQLHYLQQVLAGSTGAIMVVDLDGLVTEVNPAFCQLTGYSREQVMGKEGTSLVVTEKSEEMRAAIRAVVDANGVWREEQWMRRQDGNMIPAQIEICALFDEHGVRSHVVVSIVDMSEQKDSQTLIQFLAHRDGLTGLANRLTTRQYFCAQVAKAKSLTLLAINVDRFNTVNNLLGYQQGDDLLKTLAAQLQELVAEPNILAREGGDEFIAILPEANPTEVEALAQRILTQVEAIKSINQHPLDITASIGISSYPEHGNSYEDLVRTAKYALDISKQQGGGLRTYFTSDLELTVHRRLQMEACLRSAINNDELFLVYQPKLNLTSFAIEGAEALVRWQSPELGFVSPAEFIPLAEEAGLIIAIDEWVLESVCAQMAQWLKQGVAVQSVSVNLSTLQLHRTDLCQMVAAILAKYKLAPRFLDLEITEGMLMQNVKSAVPLLLGLKELGVTISLDDFGTGYSSLGYLQKLPINTLKIDKSFIDNVHTQESDAIISRTIISLAQSLGLEVVAEGVEEQAQMDFLRGLHCHKMQGYFFSKPLLPADYQNLVQHHNAAEWPPGKH